MFNLKSFLQPAAEPPQPIDDLKIFKNLDELDPYDADPIDIHKSEFLKFLLIFASGIIFFCFSIFTVSLLTLLFKQNLSSVQFYCGTLLTLLFTVFSARFLKLKWFVGLGAFVLIAISVFGSLLISRQFMDLTYDGQSYHQAGVIALDKGWNPLYQELPEGFVSKNMRIWTSSYPHANNYDSLAVYKVTGNLEDGKLFGFLIVLACAIFAFLAAASATKRVFEPIVISLIVSISPVSLMQVFSFGLDGQFYCLATMFFATLVMIYQKVDVRLNYLNLFFLIVLLVNNKLTSVAYLAVFIFVYAVALFINKIKLKVIFRQISYLFACLLIAFLGFGFQPFVTNFRTHLTPLYPAMVVKKDDFKYDFTENRPSNWKSSNTLALFASSIFFKTNGDFFPPKDAAEFKIPFTFTEKELKSFVYLGPKSGGFGVMFSGIILLTLIILLMYLFDKRSKYKLLFLSTLLGLIASCLINPLSNNARYVPQLWLFAPIVILFCFHNRGVKYYVISGLIVLTIFVNGYLIFNNDYGFNKDGSNQNRQALQQLSKLSESKPIIVNFGPFDGNQYLLKNNNVNYLKIDQPVAEFSCPEGSVKTKLLPIGNSESQYCK